MSGMKCHQLVVHLYQTLTALLGNPSHRRNFFACVVLVLAQAYCTEAVHHLCTEAVHHLCTEVVHHLRIHLHHCIFNKIKK